MIRAALGLILIFAGYAYLAPMLAIGNTSVPVETVITITDALAFGLVAVSSGFAAGVVIICAGRR